MSGLQVVKLWIPKDHLAEKFGVTEKEFAVTKVESLSDGLELTLCFDSKVENENLAKLDSDPWDIRRVHIDDLDGKNDGLKLYDKDGNLTFHIDKNGNGISCGTLAKDSEVEVGNALKNIVKRIQTDNVKEKLSNLGIEYKDGDTVTDLFKEVNVKLKESSSNEELLKEIAIALGGLYNLHKTLLILNEYGKGD